MTRILFEIFWHHFFLVLCLGKIKFIQINTNKYGFQGKPCRKQTMNTTDKWSVFKLTTQSFGNMTSPALVGLGDRWGFDPRMPWSTRSWCKASTWEIDLISKLPGRLTHVLNNINKRTLWFALKIARKLFSTRTRENAPGLSHQSIIVKILTSQKKMRKVGDHLGNINLCLIYHRKIKF